MWWRLSSFNPRHIHKCAFDKIQCDSCSDSIKKDMYIFAMLHSMRYGEGYLVSIKDTSIILHSMSFGEGYLVSIKDTSITLYSMRYSQSYQDSSQEQIYNVAFDELWWRLSSFNQIHIHNFVFDEILSKLLRLHSRTNLWCSIRWDLVQSV